jgi:hypothetical protein
VIAMLGARGILLDRAAREQILGEQDLQRLDRWILRAVRCSTVAELFAEP